MVIHMNAHVDQIIAKTLGSEKEYTVIIANGLYPTHRSLKQLMLDTTSLICCDGAADKLLERHLVPSYVIGDCDSMNNKAREAFAEKMIIMESQNENDLSKAYKLARGLGVKNLVILGATGLREDHSLANIYLLSQFTKEFGLIYLISDYGIFTAHSEDVVLDSVVGQQISFFTTENNTELTCQELKWPLNKFKFSGWNSGTLNQSTADKLNLHIKNGQVIVYRSFEVRE